ncbi:hypothetical protein BDR04DRAFT_1121949 [Suillus decipiens]|nr:hypothetical protein BDR04DRAFT_1121949 [Suillus decipiens]
MSIVLAMLLNNQFDGQNYGPPENRIAGMWTLVHIQMSGDRTLVAFSFADIGGLHQDQQTRRRDAAAYQMPESGTGGCSVSDDLRSTGRRPLDKPALSEPSIIASNILNVVSYTEITSRSSWREDCRNTLDTQRSKYTSVSDRKTEGSGITMNEITTTEPFIVAYVQQGSLLNA